MAVNISRPRQKEVGKTQFIEIDCKVCVEQKNKPTKISQKFYKFFT